MQWDVPGDVVLFDAAWPGHESTRTEHLRVALEPGRYTVRAAYVEPGPEIWMGLSRSAARAADVPRLPSPTAGELRRDPLPLRGRTALVTGAGRRGGIGYAVARRLAAYGAGVYLHHHVPHDAAMPWGADRPEEVVAAVRATLGDPDAPVADGPADLSDPSAPAELIATAAEALGGRLDILVANHALSGSDGTLDTVDAAMLDAHWAVDTRSVLLLVQAYARRRAATPAAGTGGRVVMMTSGQDIAGGMPEEIAYALQKGALASITRSLATALAERGVTVNTVNPGPWTRTI